MTNNYQQIKVRKGNTKVGNPVFIHLKVELPKKKDNQLISKVSKLKCSTYL